MLPRRLFNSVYSLILAGMLSIPANATFPYFDVLADQGAYSPIALGEDVTLDACSSTFLAEDGTSGNFNVCDIADLTDFRFIWRVKLDGNLIWKQTYKNGNASNGTQVSFTTGAGSIFATAGNYLITLIVRVNNNVDIALPLSGWGSTGSDGTWVSADNGLLNISKDKNVGLTITAVPEPYAALLLIPALALIRRRELKHSKVSSK